MILLLTLELKGLVLIHVHNYESGSHQSDLQGKPTRSPALPRHWLLLVRILHYDWNTTIGYSKINRLSENMKKRRHITPLPPHNGHLSTTATFFCPQKLDLVEWFNCKLKYKTNIFSIEKKKFRKTWLSRLGRL